MPQQIIDIQRWVIINGQPMPADFRLNDILYTIRDYGRAWEDMKGSHILVLLNNNQTTELIRPAGADIWWVNNDLKSKHRI